MRRWWNLDFWGDYEPPEGAVVRYVTKRHWYEIVAEVSDAIWWVSLVLLISISLASWIHWRLIAFALLAIPPLGPLLLELLRWHSEKLLLVDYPNNKTMIVKVQGWFSQKHIKDWVGSEGREETSTPTGRLIGFRRVQLTFATRTYISGQRVPVQFLKELDRAISVTLGEPAEGERGQIMQSLLPWMHSGLVDEAYARMFVKTVMGQNL